MKKAIQRQLAVIWTNEPPYRYVPRAINGGPGWEVFDRKEQRAVPDGEVAKLTFENCIEKIAN